MAIEVDFITLGDASERLETPPATVRHWTDQLEDFGVHYVLRNNRNERIYFESDLKILAFFRDLKSEYGRRTTSRDLAYMVVDKADQGEFTLRSKEDAPLPSQPSNRTADLLNQEDIKRLMESERVKQFIGIVIGEATKAMRAELIEDIRETVRVEVQSEIKENYGKLMESLESVEKKLKENSDSDNSITDEIANIKKSLEETNSLVTESIKESRADRIKREQEDEEKKKNKGFIAKLLGL